MAVFFPWLLPALLVLMLGLVWRLSRGLPRQEGDAGKEVREELRLNREETRAASREFREEVAASLERLRQSQEASLKGLQEGGDQKSGELRKELSEGMKGSHELLSKNLDGQANLQKAQLDGVAKQLKELGESNQAALERIRATLDARVRELQENNDQKLEAMRKTVDEKLQDTLEKRLGESFKLVSERLEAVHKGLGEMQNLASGVGDLKRVLTNVKSRGTWAEFQLGAILEQVLTPEQWSKNVAVKPGSAERVEYAVRLPGPRDSPGEGVWLPIDSKFPKEDYERLQAAAERSDAPAVQAAAEALTRSVRKEARDIHEKYVSPPFTTDFGILFLATEGLYAEVLRQPDFVEELLREHRVVVAGPTTLAAILSSLRLGFQTLAIEQRTAEVWKVLGAVKTEFSRFGEVLDKVKKQLASASDTLEKTGARSRAIERSLRRVERLPEHEASGILEPDLGDRPGLGGTEEAALGQGEAFL